MLVEISLVMKQLLMFIILITSSTIKIHIIDIGKIHIDK